MTPRGSSGPGASAPGRPPFALILAITVTGIMGNVLITPALPDIARDLEVSTAEVGMLVAAATAPGILLAPLIGVLADRFGRREVVVPCLVVFGLAGGLASFAPGFWALVGLRLLQGVGSAGLVNLAVVIISDHWQGTERARTIGRNAAALTMAIVVLPPLGGVLTRAWGWRATFAPYWLALLTAGAVAARLPRSAPRPGTLRGQLQASALALRPRAVLGPLALGAGVFLLVFGLVLTALPIYLDDAFGVDAAGRGLMLSLPALTSTAAALSLGRLKATVDVTRLVVAALVLFGLGFALMAAVPALAAVGVGLLLYGAGEGMVIPALQDKVVEVAPEGSRGAVVASWVGFARAGQTAGPVLAGAGLSSIGARASFAAGAVVALLLAAAHRPLLAAPHDRQPAGSPRDGRQSPPFAHRARRPR